MSVPKTEEILYDYIRTYLKERGHTLGPLEEFQEKGNKSINDNSNEDHHDNYQKEICQSFIEMSNELGDFIMRNYNEIFEKMVNDVLKANKTYTHFEALADSLFTGGITWFQIVTFLTFGAELACKAINDNLGDDKENTDGDDAGELNGNRDKVGREESCDRMVSHIIKCFSRYINDNLMQWIQTQDGGWMSIKRCDLDGQNGLNQRGMKYYFRMATFAAFVGGLYFYSKLILQK